MLEFDAEKFVIYSMGLILCVYACALGLLLCAKSKSANPNSASKTKVVISKTQQKTSTQTRTTLQKTQKSAKSKIEKNPSKNKKVLPKTKDKEPAEVSLKLNTQSRKATLKPKLLGAETSGFSQTGGISDITANRGSAFESWMKEGDPPSKKDGKGSGKNLKAGLAPQKVTKIKSKNIEKNVKSTMKTAKEISKTQLEALQPTPNKNLKLPEAPEKQKTTRQLEVPFKVKIPPIKDNQQKSLDETMKELPFNPLPVIKSHESKTPGSSDNMTAKLAMAQKLIKMAPPPVGAIRKYNEDGTPKKKKNVTLRLTFDEELKLKGKS